MHPYLLVHLLCKIVHLFSFSKIDRTVNKQETMGTSQVIIMRSEERREMFKEQQARIHQTVLHVFLSLTEQAHPFIGNLLPIGCYI